MKRIKIISLVLSVLFCVTGCNNSQISMTPRSNENSSSETTSESITINESSFEEKFPNISQGSEVSSNIKNEQITSSINPPKEHSQSSESRLLNEDIEEPINEDMEPPMKSENNINTVIEEKINELVTFKITDSKGNPIPNVYLRINWGTPSGRTTRYSDENGMINYDFSQVGLGTHTIDILEQYKIKKEVRHQIKVEEFPSEYTLIWDFGNPNDIIYKPESSVVLHFNDVNQKPIVGKEICAGYFSQEDDGDDLGYELLAIVGVLDDNGCVVWNDPPKNRDIELHIEYNDEVQLYNLNIPKENAETDYYFEVDGNYGAYN